MTFTPGAAGSAVYEHKGTVMKRLLAPAAMAATLLSGPALAQTTISQLPPASPFNGSEMAPIVQVNGGVGSTRRVSIGSSILYNVGTSGHTVCLLDAACAWSALQTFNLGISTPSITGMTTPLSAAQGGTGSTSIVGGLGYIPTPHVANNTALQALSTAAASTVIRDSYASYGDAPPLTYYASGSACSSPDGGAQVSSADGKCWVAQFQQSLGDVREWGAVLNGTTDDGNALRKACAWAAANLGVVTVPSGKTLLVNSKDTSGLAGVVMGTGTQGSNGCPLYGQRSADYPDATAYDAPQITLGANLNVPLILIQQGTNTPTWQDLVLNGNRSNQTGCTAPGSGVNFCPGNKLYTVVVADKGSATNDASVRLERVVIEDGFNGNFYLGAGRGAFWVDHAWFQYSGQNSADYAVYLNGYDSTFNNVQIGSNAGTGVFVAEGSQYQFNGGAIFLNNRGMEVYGNHVSYMTVQGLNFQGNSCGGVKVDAADPFNSAQSIGHVWANDTFDGNSQSGNNLCSDFTVVGSGSTATSTPEQLVNPQFIGNEGLGGTNYLPQYNINVSAGALVRVANLAKPVQTTSGGTVQAGAAYATAFTNSPASVLLSNAPIENSFGPLFETCPSSCTSAPSPTYAVGSWSRNNNEVTVHISEQTNGFTGLSAGSVLLGGFPYFSTSTSNDFALCTVEPTIGWTPQAGYTHMYGLVAPGTTTAYLYEWGPTKNSVQVQLSEFASGSQIYATCTYHTDN